MKKEKSKAEKQGEAQANGPQQPPDFHPGSTTQGGSNFGQGSMHLGADANKQGSEKNRGSNYENEPDVMPE